MIGCLVKRRTSTKGGGHDAGEASGESHSQDKGRSASLRFCGDRPLHGHLERHPSSRRRSAHAGVPQGGVQGSVPRMVARRGRWLQRFVHECRKRTPRSSCRGFLTPESLKPGDERLGWGDGLKAGYKAGVDFGVELGRAARTPQPTRQRWSRRRNSCTPTCKPIAPAELQPGLGDDLHGSKEKLDRRQPERGPGRDGSCVECQSGGAWRRGNGPRRPGKPKRRVTNWWP